MRDGVKLECIDYGGEVTVQCLGVGFVGGYLRRVVYGTCSIVTAAKSKDPKAANRIVRERAKGDQRIVYTIHNTHCIILMSLPYCYGRPQDQARVSLVLVQNLPTTYHKNPDSAASCLTFLWAYIHVC
jgi:hypothetical protein